MISELQWIRINNVNRNSSVQYDQNFLFSTHSHDEPTVWWVNILTVVTFLLFVPALALFFRSARNQIKFRRLIPVAILALVTFFMALPLSRPFWRVSSVLQQVQFPWRWLALISMTGSLLAGASVPLWLENKMQWRRPLRLLVLGSVLISVAFTLAHTVREAEYRNARQFQSDLQSVRGTASVNYWIPIWANSHPREMASEVEAGVAPVKINSWTPEHRSFAVAPGAAKELRVRTFYYPLWVASSAAQLLSTRPDSDGALLITLPGNTSSSTSVSVDFREPRRTRVAVAVSVLGWLFIGFMAIASVTQRKKLSI